MIDWDDLVIGPALDVFGQAVTYRPANGAAMSITAVFDREFLDYDADSDAARMVGAPGNISATRPVLGVRLSDFLTAPAQNDTLTVSGLGSFKVMEVRSDSHGWAKLLLNNL